MEMEKKEEIKWELDEVEDLEQDEASLVVRKSRNLKSETVEFEVSDSDSDTDNGVSEGNGHTTSAANGAQIEKSIPGEEQDTVEEPGEVLDEAMNGSNPIPGDGSDGVLEEDSNGAEEQGKRQDLDGVLGNSTEAMNGEKKPENLVFYDKDEGVGLTYKHNGEKQVLKDPESINKPDFSSLGSAVQKNGNFSGTDIELSQNHVVESSESSKEIESVDVDLINEDDLEATDFEVERVLKEQNTHDLYCPNCKSCITKRVILRKRKRRIRIYEEDVKRNKKESAVVSKLGAAATSQSTTDQVQHSDEVGNDAQLPSADEDERSRGTDIFRCLSCFSFFIPIGNGLVRLFRQKNPKVNVAGEQTPNIKKDEIPSTSMPASNQQETAAGQETSSETDAGVVSSSKLDDQIHQSSISATARLPFHAPEGLVAIAGDADTEKGKDKILTLPGEKPLTNGKVITSTRDPVAVEGAQTIDAKMENFDSCNENQLKESKVSKEVNINRDIVNIDLSVTALSSMNQFTNGEHVEEAVSIPKEDGLKLLISPNKGSPSLESLKDNRMPNQTMQFRDKEDNHLSPAVIQASDRKGKLNISMSVPHGEQDARHPIPTESVLENKPVNFGANANTGGVYQPEVTITETKLEVHYREPLKLDSISYSPAAQGKDAVITIDAQTTGPSQIVPAVIHTTEATPLLQQTTQHEIAGSGRSEERKEFEIEVIKSIVYGGLAESITSLSVVSSAAGGGASTLNILALGMANLIGGLFIIFHNLWELKDECPEEEQVSNQISDGVPERKNRYKELLGRRQNFVLHATVAIISYVVFGLVPPVAYGFSFREADDRQLKLVVVAAASLVCIVALAIGRAYVQQPPKPYLKSVMTFVILGFMVSGVSYAAGELVERLLMKLGLFQPAPVSNLLEAWRTPSETGWAIY